MRFVFLLLIVFSLQASGQAPQAINYQGILRNASGQAIPNKQVTIRVSVSTNSVVDNSSVYSEEISAKTNEFGIYNVAIGKGKATKGTFASIAWGANKYWVLIELDENLSNKFEFAGSMELASVPYALYAEKAKSLDNPIAGPAGPQGPQGLQGIKGDKGDTGATGPTGAQGLQGIKGDKGDTGTQGPIGLTGPAGATGANGAQGLQGLQGIKGDTGTQGPIGLTGLAGANGANGAQGLQGLQGIKGDTGTQGPIGLTGLAGANGANGAQGPIGLTGPAGANGANGTQGPIGLTGATGPAGAQGLQGLQGPIGLTGATGVAGAQGPQGLQGIKGDTGTQGPIGLTGPAGANGANGAQGPIGLTGAIGITGATGPAGLQGPQGTAGTDGKTVLNGAADPISSTGNNGDFYINTTSNKLFGPKASGAWNSGLSLIGPQGIQGVAGAQGPIGVTGPAGATGPTGASGSGGANMKIYSTSGQFTVPTGVLSIVLEMWGGGSSGSPSSNGTRGMFAKHCLSVTPGDVLTVTVGSGGPYIGYGFIIAGGKTSVGSIFCGGGAGKDPNTYANVTPTSNAQLSCLGCIMPIGHLLGYGSGGPMVSSTGGNGSDGLVLIYY